MTSLFCNTFTVTWPETDPLAAVIVLEPDVLQYTEKVPEPPDMSWDGVVDAQLVAEIVMVVVVVQELLPWSFKVTVKVK